MKKLISPKGKRIIKNAGFTVAIPITVLLVLMAVCAICGVRLFPSQVQYKSFLSSLFVVTFIAWAFALNLNSGRMDFSLGSTMIISAIIGGKIAVTFEGFNFITIFIITIGVGCILGAVSGALYIFLKLPSVITGLGAALIFEALSFILTDGMGISISKRIDIMKMGTSVPVMIVLLIIGIIFMVILTTFTTFGYNYKALQHGQKISVNVGLKEKRNALLCYIVSGGLMAVAGFYNICQRGFIEASFGLSSVGIAFVALLPIFLGGWISKKCNTQVAIFTAAVTTALISIAFIQLNVSVALRSLFNSMILLGFLIYLNNENKLKELHLIKKIKNIFVLNKNNKIADKGNSKN